MTSARADKHGQPSGRQQPVRPNTPTSTMTVAVQGCCHGELDAIYDQIEDIETQRGSKVDLLLICGDFQALRNEADLKCMVSPERHHHMGDFQRYYSGETKTPIPTIIIGGNHEASNYMWELYHGGFVAPNIYYLGASGVVNYNGLKIAGASGIFASPDYTLGHHETLPYDRRTIKSIYRVRQYEIAKLMQITSTDVFLSHDWPQAIEQYGNVAELLKHKPGLKGHVKNGDLGSPPFMDLLKRIRPPLWFAAHHHINFEAEVVHDAAESSNAASSASGAKSTLFIALDKCLPKRDGLTVFDVEVPESHRPPRLMFDPEWLAITRAMHPYLSLTRHQVPLPSPEILRAQIEDAAEWVTKRVGKEREIVSVQTFQVTAPTSKGTAYPRPLPYTNPQTLAFCKMLGIENKVNPQ